MGKKLKVGWFSFSCCEDSTIVFTELLNDHYQEWLQLMDFKCARVLKRAGEIRGIDVSFVEGAIGNKKAEEKLKKIRKNSKKVVAIGSCAVTGNPSGQRGSFSPELKREIEPVLRKYHLRKTVRKISDVVRVDASIPGCPMSEKLFIEAVEKLFVEFGVKNA